MIQPLFLCQEVRASVKSMMFRQSSWGACQGNGFNMIFCLRLHAFHLRHITDGLAQFMTKPFGLFAVRNGRYGVEARGLILSA